MIKALRTTIVTASAALMMTGCSGPSHPAAPPTQGGEPFFPAYVEMLRTGHYPQDNCSNPTDLAEMMLAPCDHR